VTGLLRAVAWSQRGDSVLYSQNGDQIFVRAADGSGAPVRALQLRDWSVVGRMSAWGPWIAFSSQTGTNTRQIGVAHRDSMGLVRALGKIGTEEQDPAISPDGRWLAFTSRENGRDEVFVTSFPVPGGRLQVSLGGGDYATWARDGRTLYFQERNQIMAASFTPGPTPTIGAPRLLYRRDPWGVAAVSSDGQLLVFADAAREGAPMALTVQQQAVRRIP
jgi:Tol biopolymer transport system component